MTKIVYIIFKKAVMSREEFNGYWKETQAPIAKPYTDWAGVPIRNPGPSAMLREYLEDNERGGGVPRNILSIVIAVLVIILVIYLILKVL
jgi:hypothetical protein